MNPGNKRSNINQNRSKRDFKKRNDRTHVKNVSLPPRGGIRL